jgi:hypothetical protein
MMPRTGRFDAAIRSSHEMVVQVDAYLGGELLAENLPVTAGEVSLKSGEGVRGECNLTIVDKTGALLATSPTSPLAIYGQELHIQRGIRYGPNDVELISLGWFRIQTNDAREYWRLPADVDPLTDPYDSNQWEFGGAEISINGLDRFSRISDDRFLQASQPPEFATCISEMVRLTEDILPIESDFGWYLSDRDVPRSMVYEEDRGAAIASLAAAANGRVYVDNYGVLVARALQQTYIDGPAPRVTSITTQMTRDGIYNAVVARGEEIEGLAPVQGLAVDVGEFSPTRWDGNFGHVPMFYASPVLRTQDAVDTAARTRLNSTQKNRERQFSLTVVPNPTYEPYDIIPLRLPGYREFNAEIVDLTIPLTPQEQGSLVLTVPESVLAEAADPPGGGGSS